MAYTAAQQQRIDQAAANVDSAKQAYDAAQSTLASLDRTARDINASVFQCNGFRNRALDYQILNPSDCTPCTFNSNCPQCNTKSECERRVRVFNDAFTAWTAYQSTANSASVAYEAAKTALSNLLNAIAIESNNDPAVIIANKQIEAQKNISQSILKSRTVQIAIFGVVVLIIVGVMVAVLRR